MTNYELIKNMSIEEMAEFIRLCISDSETHDIGCYQCINYGTHHYTDGDCDNCKYFEVGLDVKKYLESTTMINKCKYCTNYEENYVKGRGYCHFTDCFVKPDDNCTEYEED